MPEARDLLRLRPPQEVDPVRRAEAFPGSVNRRQDFSGILRAIDALRRVEADIAIAAGLDPLPEILQQRRPAAGRRLAVAEQRIETLVLPALAVGPGILVPSLPTSLRHQQPLEFL